MPEECTVSSSSATPSSWWDLHQPNSIPSWYSKNPNNPNGSCEDDVSISTTSITNASNHSGLTTESSYHCFLDQSASSDELLKEHASGHTHHLWSHVLLHGGSSVDLHDGTKSYGEHVIDPLASKYSSTVMFEPTNDHDNYLKKMDDDNDNNNSSTNWGGYTNQFARYGFNEPGLVQTDRLNKLVGNWSIAPPNSNTNHDHHHFDHHHHHHPDQTCDISLCGSTIDHDQYKQSSLDDFQVKNEEIFYKNLEVSTVGSYHNGLNGSMIQADSQYINGVPHSPCSSSRSFLDIRLTRPLMDVNPAFKPCFKALKLSEFKKKELRDTSMTTKTLGITIEGKKKRSDDMSDEVSKKPKNNNVSSAASPVKEPKAKLRDKITTLQQIVSPFGKTDTASVLQEALNYIRFLQEQVQLLSNPYMKISHKDPWGDGKCSDLMSKGLCLVPISCTPQVYHESTGSDYWGQAYRGGGCLYR